MSQAIRRPRYLNLLAIRLPLPGFVSILHRISGMLMILALPFLAWALDVAMTGAAGFAQVGEVFAHPLVKLLLLAAIWSLMHHLCAGIRFLLLDAHVGVDLPKARLGAWIALGASTALTLVVGGALLL